MPPSFNPAIAALCDQIARMEGESGPTREVLPFGVPALDRRLPGGRLALGCLHEVAGDGNGAVDGAAASCFAAGIVARLRGQVLWCVTQAGLGPDRVIYVEAGDDVSVLACMEDGLRHGGLGAVVADVARLSMTASRRLHLAAKGPGTPGIALRRWRRQQDTYDFGQPTAAMTRWRISVLPSAPLPVPGLARARWLIDLIRARASDSLDIELEACNGTGHIGHPAALADRPAQAVSA
ncbi:ImuA family protein [Paracoccus everestensis]|uniref:ImuA family protein n=1 Tax=Paracoccus everestensis TaxID=2903900 RepID=UPI001F23CD87|nr:damage-inducible protein [Paracoccus everestensis]